jgi:cell division GTPase FtsZ
MLSDIQLNAVKYEIYRTTLKIRINMSSPACSEDECNEIYDCLKLELPHIPDHLLKELADNFIYDAVVDIDVADIISVLSQVSPVKTFTCEFYDADKAILALQDLIAKIAARSINLHNVAGVLLVIKSYTMKLDTFHYLMNTLRPLLNPQVSLMTAWYSDESMGAGVNIRLIFTGMATLEV